jgi:hypothetical protein
MKILALIFSMTVSVGDLKFETIYEQDLPNAAIAITESNDGEFIEVIVNEWQDTAHTQDGIKKYIFQQGYDYSKKQGFIRTYSTDRKLINETYSADYDGMVVREELLQAFEIFKSNHDILKLLMSTDEVIRLHGGFNYADKNKSDYCYKGSRCVHVFASTLNHPVLAHAIVKLTDKSIPYPHFDMEQFKKKNKKVEK